MNVIDATRTVEETIKRFYCEGANDVHQMLLQFQASPEAWCIVWHLLDPSKSWEVQYFAASTLHAKVLKQWCEIPSTEYVALKNQILGLMMSPTTPKLIRLKLCEALAAFLANHCCSEDGDSESTNDLMEELMRTLPHNAPETLDLLLRVLLALLNDAEKRPPAKRAIIKRHLDISSTGTEWTKITWLLQHVLSLCKQLQSHNNDYNSLYLLALECALAWIKLGPSLDLIAQLFDHFPIAAAHYTPEDPGCDDDIKAWEVVQDFLTIALSNDSLRGMPLFWAWAHSIVSVAQQKNSIWFAAILTRIGDSYARQLLLALMQDCSESQRWTAETLIKLLLDCTDCPGRYPIDERHSSTPLSFWYSLKDTIDTLDAPLDNRAKEVLKPIYIRLTHTLLKKATLPLVPADAGSPDDRELLRCYRQDVADTFAYCYAIVRQDVLVIFGQRLTQPMLDTLKWPDVEITLYAIQALSDWVSEQENEYVSALIDLIISHISYDRYPPEVLACACSTLGSYAEWIGENPDPWMERSLQLITYGLTHNSVALTRASMALKDIARECQSNLTPLAPSMLDTISKTLTTLPSGSADGRRLMYSAGDLISALPSTKEQLKYMDNILGLCVSRLNELLQQPTNSANIAAVNQLQMATTFLSTLESGMGKTGLKLLLPIFNQLVCHPAWNQDDQILQAMYLCIERSLQCLLRPEDNAKPLLSLLVISYKKKPHPSALNLLKQMIRLFGIEKNQLIDPYFMEINTHTLNGLNACKMAGGNLSDFCDLLVAYFELLAATCKRNCGLFKMNAVYDRIPEMLHYAVDGLGFPERTVVEAAGTFLSNAINEDSLLKYIRSIGYDLVCMILQCIGGRSEHKNLAAHARVLHALKKELTELGMWLRTAMAEGIIATTPVKKEGLIHVIINSRQHQTLYEQLQKFSLEIQKPAVGL